MKTYISYIDKDNTIVKIVQHLDNDLCFVENEEGRIYQRYFSDLRRIKITPSKIVDKVEFL